MSHSGYTLCREFSQSAGEVISYAKQLQEALGTSYNLELVELIYRSLKDCNPATLLFRNHGEITAILATDGNRPSWVPTYAVMVEEFEAKPLYLEVERLHALSGFLDKPTLARFVAKGFISRPRDSSLPPLRNATD